MEPTLILCLLVPVLSQSAMEIEPQDNDNKGLQLETLYANDNIISFNQVVGDEESELLEKMPKTKGIIDPLKAEDVKCMMSVDKYCGEDMLKIKKVIISAVTNDCKECSDEEKNKAGHVIAALMAHDPVAWKLFLTRTAVILKPDKQVHKIDALTVENTERIGFPEEVPESRERFLLPDFQVNVERYAVGVKKAT